MFQHILVPLDGSQRAERAIPVAACIARATGGSLLLVRVVAQPGDPLYVVEPFVLPQEVPVTADHTASVYLATIAQMEELRGISVQMRVLTGAPAQHILSCIETQAIDLVILSSRGETGLRRWAFGSVAQKVLRHSTAPVLILHESAGPLSNQHPDGRRPVRVLVALDGSSLAETALFPAAVLSAALSAPEKGNLHLVRVLPRPRPTSAAEAMSGARQLDISEAQTYLHVTEQALRDALQGEGDLTLHSSVVVHHDVAETIIRAAEEGLPVTVGAEAREACDVVAIATHGRSGPARWVMGSIAERVLDGTRLPLFVVHPSESTEGRW